MTSLMFHVRHNARPKLVDETLDILAGRSNTTLDEMLTIGEQHGYLIGTAMQSKQALKENPLQVARDLGLIEVDRLALTPLGYDAARLRRQKPPVWDELMHVLFYTRWRAENEAEHCFSWSYRTVCDTLWEASETDIDRGQLVSYVAERAMERFHTTRVSFSKDSVRGVLQWLAPLQPALLDANAKTFKRRAFCPPETVVLAVDALYHQVGADYQTNVLLNAERRESICKVCLLEPTAFDTVLDWATGQYAFLQRGSSGSWGSYVLLTRRPQLEDFLG